MLTIFLLLINNNLGALQCFWAILDFVAIVGYTSHTEETLQYISHGLMQINKTKDVFKNICYSDNQI